MRYASAVLLMIPVAGLAEEVPAPDGCFDVVTIQTEQCYVKRVMNCSINDDDIVTLGYNGLDAPVMQVVDTQGMMIFIADSFGTETEIGAVADRLELDVALQDGTDDFDYVMNRDGQPYVRIVGTIKDTGRTDVIDDRPLRVLSQYDTMMFGDIEMVSEFTLHYDEALGVLLSSRLHDPEVGEVLYQRTPVDFLFPGDAGARDMEPAYGCE